MLLVLMSLEKCFAVYFPIKAKIICTVKTAKWTNGVSGVILAAYHSVNFFVFESRKSSDGHFCGTIDIDFETINIIDTVLYSLGPFVLMSTANFAIVFKFMRAKCKTNIAESTSQALGKSATRGTAMVVTVSITFLLLTAPTAVYNGTYSSFSFNSMYRIYMNFTQYLNHSINGILYCIVGSKFRAEFLKLIACNRRLKFAQYPIHSKNITHTTGEFSSTTK